MNLRNSKSMLAKLLATENITVEHGNYQTAAFDPKNRVLYLPVFRWMDGDVYDLLVLHEVSHALNTPADGWHSADNSKGKGYKSFLNVTEDARIEKKIKRKYPGASKAMVLGYRELMRQDFFGIKHINVEKLPLIDRINLHTKGGASMGIEFSEEEKVWVDELMKLETFDEIVEYTNRLYDYCAENESETDNHDMSMMSNYYEDSDEDDFDMMGESPADWDENETEETDGNSGMKGESGEPDEEDDSDGPESESDSDSGKSSADKFKDEVEKAMNEMRAENESKSEEKSEEKSEGSNETQPTPTAGGYGSETDMNDKAGPRSITDEYFRAKEEELNEEIDEDKKFIYADLPKPDLKEIVWDYKLIQEEFEKYYGQESSRYYGTLSPKESWNTAPKVFKKFREENKSIIDYLAKEFEMKKRADEYKRTASANTGLLDTSKLYSYRYSENLFKRVATVQSGKNHGLVMFIDWSGSMQANMAGTMEQLMILVMFCRKVHIPFDVYAFSDRLCRMESRLFTNNSSFGESREPKEEKKPNWELGPNTMIYEDRFNLMQLFSNKMSNTEFNKACWNAINIRDFYKSRQRYSSYDIEIRNPQIPNIFGLGGTPLNASIVAAHDLIRKFKKDNNVQIVNSVFLTDGDSHSCNAYRDRNNVEKHIGSRDNLTIRDRESKTEISRKMSYRHREQTEMLFDSLRKSVGVNIIGFFLVNRIDRHKVGMMMPKHGKTSYEDFMTMWRKEKCLVTDIDGYDNLYIIKDGADLQVDGNSELDKVDAGAKKSAIRSAFKKMNRKKLRNRVVLNKFVELVA